MTSVTGTQDAAGAKGVRLTDLKNKSDKAGRTLKIGINTGLVGAGKCKGYNGAINPPDMTELKNGVLRLQSDESRDSGVEIDLSQDVSSYTHLEFKVRATIKDLRRSYTPARLVVQLFPKGDGGFIEMNIWNSSKGKVWNPNWGSEAHDENGIVLNSLYSPADIETKGWITVRVSLTGYPNNNSYNDAKTKLASCSKILFQVNGDATSDVQIKDLRFVSSVSSSIPTSATTSADSLQP